MSLRTEIKRMIEESLLKPGDILRIGSLEFGVQINGSPENMETVRPATLYEEEIKTEIVDNEEEPKTPQDNAFENMIHDLDDFDMHQTMNTEQKVDVNQQ